MGTYSKRFVLEKLAWLTILALFVFRIANPSAIPFIFDEPKLQLMIDEHFARGTIPTHGLEGSQGLTYGPLPIWIYTFIRLFTSQVTTIGVIHNLIFTLSLIIGFYFCRKQLSRAAGLLFLILGLLSPLLTFYSRLPWDNTFQLPLSLILISLTFSTLKHKHFVSGIVSGLLFCTHLMSIPLIAVSALYRERSIKNISLRGIGFLIPSLIYLPGLIHNFLQGNQRRTIPWMEAIGYLPRDLIGGFQSLTMQRMKYFATTTLGDFFRQFPFDFIWVLLPLVFYFGFIRTQEKRSINLYFLITLIAHALFFNILKIDASHPHYFMPVFGVSLLLFSGLFISTLDHSSQMIKPLTITLGVLLFAQLSLTQIVFRKTVVENNGMRDLHVGPTVFSFQTMLESLCANNTSRELRISLNKIKTVFPYSLEYQFRHHPSCSGKTLKFNPNGLELNFESLSPFSARLTVGKS